MRKTDQQLTVHFIITHGHSVCVCMRVHTHVEGWGETGVGEDGGGVGVGRSGVFMPPPLPPKKRETS